MPEKRCFYEILGCERGAGSDELRRAYKRECLKHHPDRNPGNDEAEVRFKEVNEAYQVLADGQKRQVYDRLGHAGLEGASTDGADGDVFSHMQDLFAEMFSGSGFGGFGRSREPRRGADLRVQQSLSLKDAVFGCKREVTVQAPAPCDTCSGTGATPGSQPEGCGTCRGSGQVSSARGFVMFTTTCPRCHGRGSVIKHHCKPCKGEGFVSKTRRVTVAFPAGIDAGQRLRVPGQGVPGPGSIPAGDLYVEVDIDEDARFERDGVDLVTRVHVNFPDAALGSTVSVPMLDESAEPLSVSVPTGTQSGAVFTLKGQGVPRLDGRGRGSLIVVVQVDVPKTLSARAKDLLAELRDELNLARSAPQSKKRISAS